MDHKCYIEGYEADLSEDFSTYLTYQVDDIREFGYRNSNVSKTILMPGTHRNNALFGHIFKLGSSNRFDTSLKNVMANFNPMVSARIIVFKNNMQVFKGIIRVIRIVVDNENVEYETAAFGELSNLVLKLGTRKLENLDFSAYDMAYTVANVLASMDNTPGSGVCFPLIDYGACSVNKHDWDIRTFRPAMYAKEYIDKIFAGANFKYDCALFNTDRFKRLIVPHNQKTLQSLSSGVFDVSRSATITPPPSNLILDFPTQTSLGSFTANVGNDRFTYGGATVSGVGDFSYMASGNYVNIGVLVELRINGTMIHSQFQPSDGLFSVKPFVLSATAPGVSFNTGDYVELYISYGHQDIEIALCSMYYNVPSASSIPVVVGGDLQINQCIPRNILQIDFFTSILKLFNLYVTDDRYTENLLHIKPFIDFYDGDVEDWSSKIDMHKPITIQPLSELNSRYYKFSYAEDSDFYNELYKKRYNKTYGSFVFDSEFEFSVNENEFTLIFAGSPLVGYAGEDKVYTTIYKKNNNIEENIDFKIRLLQSKKVTGVTSYNILDGVTVLDAATNYLYAGHFDDPDAPANDLNFGVPEELFFILIAGAINVNQFNVYYSSYMAEIASKDSILMIASLFLNEQDVATLDMGKFVYIHGTLFRKNKISDYNASQREACIVELLKVINTSYN